MSTGIALHIDAGPEFPEFNLGGGGTPLEHKNIFITGCRRRDVKNAFDATKTPQVFDMDRCNVFHYAIGVHETSVICDEFDAAGMNNNEIPFQNPLPDGQLFPVAAEFALEPLSQVQPASSRSAFQAVLFMHELGHNLGLRHGGNTDRTYQPNYNSVMNYRYLSGGIDIVSENPQEPFCDLSIPSSDPGNCDAESNLFSLSYSCGVLANINENNALESQGICGNKPVDFNLDGVIHDPISPPQDLNFDGLIGVLVDFPDLDNLILRLPDGGGGGVDDDLDANIPPGLQCPFSQ